MRKRHLDLEYDYPCYVCRTGFDSREQFIEHFEATHW